MANVKVTIYEAKCKLCGEKIRGQTEGESRSKLNNHIDNDCKSVKQMREWDKAGVYPQMMKLIRLEGLNKDLKKLLKHYSFDEIRDELERIEIDSCQ